MWMFGTDHLSTTVTTSSLVTYRCAHGYQIWPQNGSDWPQMGQIREIFRSDSVHFGAPRQNVLNLI